MEYKVGHVSSTSAGKCIICGKLTGTSLEVVQYQELKSFSNQIGSSIHIPVCDDHYNMVSEQKELLIGYVKNINNLLKLLRI